MPIPIEELQDTPGWVNADEPKRLEMRSRWDAADDSKREHFLNLARRTATPISAPTPQPLPVAPSRQMEMPNPTAVGVLDNLAAPAFGGAAAALTGLATKNPIAGGAAFTGVSALTRNLGRKVLGAEPESLMTEGVNVGLDAFAPVVGKHIVGPVVKKATQLTGKVAGKVLGKASGMAAREKEVAAVIDPLTEMVDQQVARLKEARSGLAETAQQRQLMGESRVANQIVKTAEQKRQLDHDNLIGANYRETAARRAPAGSDAGVRARTESAGVFENLVREQQSEFGDAYSALYEPHLNRELSESVSEQLGESAKEILTDAKNFQSIPAELYSRLAYLRKYAKKELSAEDTANAALSVEERVKAQLKSGIDPTKIDPTTGQLMDMVEEEELKPLRVGDLLRLKGDLRQFFTHQDGPTRHVATEATGDILDVFSSMGLVDPALNARYKDWRQLWDRKALRDLHFSARPEQLKAFFDAPMFGSIIDKATPAQKVQLQTTFADVVQHNKLNPEQISQLLTPELMTKLYGPAAGDVNKWMGLQLSTTNLERMFDAKPELRQLYNNALVESYNTQRNQIARQTKKTLISSLNKMGPVGQKQINLVAGMSPDEIAKAYSDVLTPEFRNNLLRQSRKEVPINLGWTQGQEQSSKRFLGYYGMGAAAELAFFGKVAPIYAVMFGVHAGWEIKHRMQKLIVRGMENGEVGKLLDWGSGVMSGEKIRKLGEMTGQVIASDTMRGGAEEVRDWMGAEQLKGMQPPPSPMPVPTQTPQMRMPSPTATPQIPPTGPPSMPPQTPPMPMGMGQPPPPPVAGPGGPPGMQQGPPPSPPPQLPQGPPPLTPQSELSHHQLTPPTFRNVAVLGQNFTDPPTVQRFQMAFDNSLQKRVTDMMSLDVYKRASPDTQSVLLKDAIRWARKNALGEMRKELGVALKRDGVKVLRKRADGSREVRMVGRPNLNVKGSPESAQG